MPTVAPVRTVKVSETDETYDPYTALIAAIVARAVQDAQGQTFAPGSQAPAQIEADARQWLQDEAAVRDLLELAGYDAAVVLHRVRRLLPQVPARQQLPLFAERIPRWPPVPSAD